jgi:histidyl-tRNA synthetase
MRTLIRTGNWPIGQRVLPMLPRYIEHIHHPYQQVRDEIGRMINEILRSNSLIHFASPEERMARDLACAGSHITTTHDQECIKVFKTVLEQLDAWHAELQPTANGASDYINASKTGK